MAGNEPGAVLDGHDVDVAALERHLGVALLQVREFGGGYSNLTYLLTLPDRQLVMRRGPKGVTIKGAHDMSREFKALSGLQSQWSKSPRPVAFCDDSSVLGAPFYLMEKVDGVVLRRDTDGLSPEVMRRLSVSLCDTLVEYHAIDLERAGLSGLGRPHGFLERQVTGCIERFRKAQTEANDELELMMTWLASNRPESPAPTMLHNDFKYDNVLVDAGLQQVVCVLDWEMATVGDPLVDLGTSLALWQQADDSEGLQAARFGPTQLPGNLSRRGFAERYAEQTGRSLQHLSWYYVLGLFRMLVTFQQLYQRYLLGHTTEPRYRAMLDAVRGMATAGATVIRTGQLDTL